MEEFKKGDVCVIEDVGRRESKFVYISDFIGQKVKVDSVEPSFFKSKEYLSGNVFAEQTIYYHPNQSKKKQKLFCRKGEILYFAQVKLKKI